MQFDKNQHQKVRYDGQLYVVLLEEFPSFHTESPDFQVALHPVGNNWIVHITNPTVRKYMMVRKGNLKLVNPEILE